MCTYVQPIVPQISDGTQAEGGAGGKKWSVTLKVTKKEEQGHDTYSRQCSALKDNLARRLGTPCPGQRIHNVVDRNIRESADNGLDHVAPDSVERVGRRFCLSATA